MFGIGDVAGWSQPGAGRDQLGVAQCPQLLAQLRWGGDKQCLELVGGLAAGFDGTASGYTQYADCLDTAVLGLGDAGRFAGQRGARCRVGVQWVGLSLGSASLTVGAGDP